MALLAYVCLFTFRVLGSIVILGKACDLIEDHKQKQQHKKKQSTEEARDHPAGPPRAKDSNAALRTDTPVIYSQKNREESCATPLLTHRKTMEAVKEPPRAPSPEDDDDSSELFQLPDRRSERLFLFQNSCDDKADVLLTNMNVALLDSPDYEQGRETSPGVEASSEGDISDRDTVGAALSHNLEGHAGCRVENLARPDSQQESFGAGPSKYLVSHSQRPVVSNDCDIPVGRVVEPEKAERAGRKVCEILFPLEAGLSPSSKAKSLSSPDLIRSEADFEEWDSDEEMAAEEDRIVFSPDGVATLESLRKRGVAQRP